MYCIVSGKNINDTTVNAIVLVAGPRGLPRSSVASPRLASNQAKKIAKCLGAIEAVDVPIAVLFSGIALNEAFELCLAAHYRICTESTRLGFNQISLGSIPCFGGTQRLPRLTGAKAALDILLNAKIIGANEAKELGLVDLVLNDARQENVELLVQEFLKEKPSRPTKSLIPGVENPRKYQSQMAEARKAVSTFQLTAADALVTCVEVAQLMPFEGGLIIERTLFDECEQSQEAVALRYVMNAERSLVTAGASGCETKTLIAGIKPFDVGLCVSILDSGLSVVAHSNDVANLNSLSARIHEIYDRVVANGRLHAELRAKRLDNFEATSDLPDTNACDVVIDPGWTQVSDLQALMRRNHSENSKTPLVLSLRHGNALSNLESSLRGNAGVIGVHFDNAAHVSRVVEVFQTAISDPKSLGHACRFLSSLRKLPVVVRDTSASVSSQLRKALFGAAEVLLLYGVEPNRIDDALEKFGFRKGPLAFRDEIGLEVNFVKGEQPATEVLLKAGRLGRDEGLGYYRYAKGEPNPRADGVIQWNLMDLRERLNIKAVVFSEEEILALCLGSMMNVGARLVFDGVVENASDIDVLAVHNLDFPRRKGGPMRACEKHGLFEVKRLFADHENKAPGLWALHPLVSELIKNGKGFAAARTKEPVS